MKPGVSVRLKVFVVIAVILSVGLTSVARAEDGRRIVIFHEGTPLSDQLQIVEDSGSKLVHTLSLINALAIELPLGGLLWDALAFLEDALEFLLDNPAVEGVFADPVSELGPISTISPAAAPQDGNYDWGQVRIGTPVVHDDMKNTPDSPEPGAGVTIAILDTGISHPLLQQNIIHAYNARPGGGSPADDNGHGTHIAGIIAARANDQDQGVIGVAPAASLVSVKVLDSNGKCHLSDFINGLQYVVDYNQNSLQKIKLVNMSLGFCADREPMKRAIQSVYDGGVIMVAAAGNRLSLGGGAEEGGGSEGEGASACGDTVRYPAAYDEWVIAVAASDVSDGIAGYSLAGLAVDVTAPGGAQTNNAQTNKQVLSTRWPGGGYGLGRGTSQAAAHVTGSSALALQHEPELSFEQVSDLLQSTAFELPCCSSSQQGAGLIDVEDMLHTLE
jgi:subtilisin family serine protease